MDQFDVISYQLRRCSEAQGRNRCWLHFHESESKVLMGGKNEHSETVVRKTKYVNDKYTEMLENALNWKYMGDAALQKRLCFVTDRTGQLRHCARHLHVEIHGRIEKMLMKAAERDCLNSVAQ
jgi:4-hydroxy-3-methylbut-2-enyl diphosphate reductase IspH